MTVTREDLAAVRERHGDTLARLADEAPPIPENAVALLRAAGFPLRAEARRAS